MANTYFRPNMYKIRLLILKSHLFHSHSGFSKLQLCLSNCTSQKLGNYFKISSFSHIPHQIHQYILFAFFQNIPTIPPCFAILIAISLVWTTVISCLYKCNSPLVISCICPWPLWTILSAGARITHLIQKSDYVIPLLKKTPKIACMRSSIVM